MKTEYLITFPSGQTAWVAFKWSMLDQSDPDDRPAEATARSCGKDCKPTYVNGDLAKRIK